VQDICTEFKIATVGCEDPTPICGDVKTAFEDCCHTEGHDRTPIKLGCNTWGCNICHYKKAVREAYKANARLNGVWEECYKYGIDLYRPVHLLTSPPPEEYHRFYDRKAYATVNTQNVKYLKEIGLIGGCTATHQVRGNTDAIRQYKAGTTALKDSWHFHSVGFMPDGHKIDSKAFYDATGWIYKNIPIITKGGARNVIAYELNHAASYKTETGASHLLRWWGALSYNAVRVVEKQHKEIKLCHVCKADKHRYYDDYQTDQGEAYEITLERRVTLTPAQFSKVASVVPQPLKPRPTTITAYV